MNSNFVRDISRRAISRYHVGHVGRHYINELCEEFREYICEKNSLIFEGILFSICADLSMRNVESEALVKKVFEEHGDILRALKSMTSQLLSNLSHDILHILRSEPSGAIIYRNLKRSAHGKIRGAKPLTMRAAIRYLESNEQVTTKTIGRATHIFLRHQDEQEKAKRSSSERSFGFFDDFGSGGDSALLRGDNEG